MISPRRRRALDVGCALLLLAVAGVATGCLEPDVGAPLVERCNNVDSDPDRDVSYSLDIEPLFLRDSAGCVECHTPGGSNPIGISVGGLDLSSRSMMLQGGARTSGDIVITGEPCGSSLYTKLISAPFGGQMPADGPPFWTDEELQLLADWIAEGARDN